MGAGNHKLQSHRVRARGGEAPSMPNSELSSRFFGGPSERRGMEWIQAYMSPMLDYSQQSFNFQLSRPRRGQGAAHHSHALRRLLEGVPGQSPPDIVLESSSRGRSKDSPVDWILCIVIPLIENMRILTVIEDNANHYMAIQKSGDGILAVNACRITCIQANTTMIYVPFLPQEEDHSKPQES